MANKKIEIQLFGDVSLNGLYCDPLYQVELKKSLTEFNQKIGRGDLRIINWEAPITRVGQLNPVKNPAIATTIESAKIFCNAFPIDIATLGNNHIGDCLQEGLDTTLDFLHSLDVKTLGAEKEIEKVSKPLVLTIHDSRIGLLNFLGSETNAKIPSELNIHVNDIDDDRIYKLIREAKNEVDYLMVALHWGIEFIQYPSPEQKNIARNCIDAGASVIIGHHSHCLQGYENYNNGIIFYSLGNFIFSGLKGKESFGWPSFCNRGGFYRLFIDAENEMSVKFHPFEVSNLGVDPKDNPKSTRIQNRLSKNLDLSDFRYKWLYRINLYKNWFVRLPLFLMRTKGGFFKGFLSYFKLKYFKLLFSYFFKKRN